MLRYGIAVALAAGSSGPMPVAAADVAAGEKIYKRVCRACHGNQAQGAGSFPNLRDQSEEHNTLQLEQYRAGATLGPNTALMAPNARKLSDEDIANLVGYIASLRP